VAAPAGYRPGRVLVVMLLAVAALAAWAFWPGQTNTPRLGLDLQGGTQVILAPTPIEEGASIGEEQLQQTVEIIRQRVNGLGIAESEVAVQGSGNDAVIVVSVPGVTQDRIVDLVGQTALLNFRPVEAILDPGPIDAQGNPIVPEQPTDGEQPLDAPEEPTAQAPEEPAPEGTQIVQSPDISEQFQTDVLALDCTDPANLAGGSPDNPNEYLGTCDQSGLAKYILQPAFIRGTNIDDAAAQLPQQGVGSWIVTLAFDAEGAAQLADVSTELSAKQPPQNQFAIVLDGVVVSAPSFREPILGGTAQIEGNFTVETAENLANVLKFGALPLNLDVQAVESVSPTLGTDQLRAGILAGIIGLALVGLYMLLYYRALGVVAFLSLVIAGLITYSAFVVLGRTAGFTLTLAGVAGAIVAIGITADSFVVYFERLRDEVRDGKSLRQAADAGWVRARRTLLAADFVSLLAAVVLYWLSVGNVRGFAFALGLTTVVDVIVAFFFTRPLVAIMCRSRWMARGGALTGVSPERLGASTLDGNRREKGVPRKSSGPAMAGAAGNRED
jgi:preprotein translocase subunit SecD